jgi:hypothetical protein
MAHYCRTAKDPTLSLTHHRLVQLLIQRGFAQQNPPVNNPPIKPQPAAEIPHEQQQQNPPVNNPPINPQPADEIPHEQQQQNPPDAPEVPHSPPTRPISPPTIPESLHTAPESSTFTLHILIDDSEPENVPYPIIQERPPRKWKQAPPFPPFLWKKRIRASTRPPLMIPTLDTPPIRLTPCSNPIPQTPGSLPIPTSVAATQEPAPDIELQESEAQISFAFEVVETQEPATGIEVEL